MEEIKIINQEEIDQANEALAAPESLNIDQIEQIQFVISSLWQEVQDYRNMDSDIAYGKDHSRQEGETVQDFQNRNAAANGSGEYGGSSYAE